MKKNGNEVFNFISILGAILTVISIPVYYLCIGHIISFVLSLIGYFDAKKCDNKGVILGLLSAITSFVFIVLGTITLSYFIHYLANGAITLGSEMIESAKNMDPEDMTLMLKIAYEIIRICF